MPNLGLDGQAALVTGASRGIGRAIALGLAEAGADLAVVGRDAATLAPLVSEIQARGRDALAVVADLSDVEGAGHVAEQARARFPQLHVLVNNAATSPFARLAQEVSLADWDAVMDVNLRGTFALTKAVGIHMISRGYGRIVNVTSVLSEQGISRSIPYTPSKAALRSLTQCLAADWAPHGITVNALAPGFIETEMNASGRKDVDFYEAVRNRIAQRRWGQPEDLAGAAVFLASPAAEYVTGTTVVVDGGFSNSWAYRN
jgi:2-dehydro-3-deoxy-D-gluconate 5-dehydrogenase